uniref:Uncharacterized protein n=1 Tax=Pyramimonas obovata TaxID=1411642 RepID=A0A7S0N7U3_9CHLO|mmetsp:Transcript_21136/g.46372  ORF Transcript_21136/g.46372 Transcript_21136/m.46372 type:complete len:301 (+) Transcript_21136:461-1363(+)
MLQACSNVTLRVRSATCWLSKPESSVTPLPSRVHRTAKSYAGAYLRGSNSRVRCTYSAPAVVFRSGSTRTRAAAEPPGWPAEDTFNSEQVPDEKCLTHFDRMVREQAKLFKPPTRGEAEMALHKYWRRKGLKEEVHLDRVVTASLEWWQQYHSSKRQASIPCLLSDMEARLRQLKTLLPRASVAKMLWKQPAMLQLDQHAAAYRIVALCALLPGVNVVRLVEKDPTFLLREDIVAVTDAGVCKLRRLLPQADVLKMVERHPSLLLRDVQAGLAKLRARMPGRDIELMVERNPVLVLKALQ